jgi:hypothetical protein
MGNKAREINSPVIKQLLDETTPEELAKIDTEMTNNKQQTAVDILCGKLAMKLGIPQAITFYIDHQEEIREAKEMEKERIETAYNKGTVHGIDYPESTLPITGEQYYNETYGGGEQ